jgi:CheY-like chemotaxis protein
MSKDRPLLGFVVLVVDDEPDNRESAALIIRQLGCDVLEASSSGEALRVLASDARVDLLFSDIAMPDEDGLTLARRARECRPGIPIVLTTGYTTIVEAVIEAGGVTLIKPYSVERLDAVLSEQLLAQQILPASDRRA